MYTIVEAEELAEMHMLMWASLEAYIPYLFKDMTVEQKYSFKGRDNRTYTITYTDKHGTKDNAGPSS